MAKSLVLFLLLFLYGAVVASNDGDKPAVVEEVTEKKDIFGEGPLPTGPTFNGQHIPVLNNEGSNEDKHVKPHVVTIKEENFGNGPLPTEPPAENGVHIPVLNDEVVKEEVIYAGEERAFKVEPKPVDFFETNPSVLPDGTPLTEGDIVLTPEQLRSLVGEGIDRKAILPNFYFGWNARWPPDSSGDIIIPYRITNSSLVDEALIEKSLQHWMNHTCLKFSRTTANGEFSHLYFSRENSGCYSNLGRIPVSGKPGGQLVSIGPTCSDFGVIVHEVGHAIGFAHEQSRRDRDKYVIVFPGNIKSGKEGNFDKEDKSSDYGVPYDYTSIMHYGKSLFSKNGNLTLGTKDPLYMNLIGIRSGLSFRDTKLANIIYNCTDKWMTNCNVAVNPCKNEGYIGKDCKCVCRDGTNGTNCETVTRSYYTPPTCGGNVTTAGSISSPYFPNSHPSSLYCIWWIRSPECTNPKLTFSAFKTYFRSSTGSCNIGGLEIRNESLYFGRKYCGIGPTYDPQKQDIKTGDIFTGSGRDLVLDFYSRYLGADTGFSGTISFVPVPNCVTTAAPAMTTMNSATSMISTMGPTMHPTTMNPTMGPTMNPTMYSTTMNPTMGPTMNPTMHPTTMNPTMGPTMNPTMGPTMHPITQQPTPNPYPRTCPPVSIISRGRCILRNYGTTWIWKNKRNSGKYNCLLYVRSYMCPRTLLITYRYLRIRRRIVSCVANTPLLGCRRRYRCCTRNPRRTFTRYRYFVPPTGNFDLREFSYHLRRNNFYIKIREIKASCHKRIALTETSPYAIVSSLQAGRGRNCEWYVQAPLGKRIRMVFLRWSSTRACYNYRKIYQRTLHMKGKYKWSLRRYWRRRCRRSMRHCHRRNGGLFIHKFGGLFYRYVRPLCHYWTPSPLSSYRNYLSISYQKFVRRRKRTWRLYPFYFMARLSIY